MTGKPTCTNSGRFIDCPQSINLGIIRDGYPGSAGGKTPTNRGAAPIRVGGHPGITRDFYIYIGTVRAGADSRDIPDPI